MTYGGDRDRHTICAVSTPSGFGGVAVIRVSGPHAFAHTRKLAGFLPEAPESHRIYYGTLQSITDKKVIDEVLVSSFHQGKSYTGDETVEISCHGSPAITQWILNELIEAGCRIADRGEFSYRAFINGKIDLVQAEGVLQMVESQSKRSAQQGLKQLKGGLSAELRQIQGELLFGLASIEAAIDFSTEDIDVLNKTELLSRLDSAHIKTKKLLSSYETGRLLRQGLQVALAGKPNVGKSSLFNLLLQENRAIVTEIPGTTRDVVESSILMDGIKLSLLDTAGLRESTDLVEQIGMQKSLESQAGADCVLYLYEAEAGLSPEDLENLKGLSPGKWVLLGNKLDQIKTPLVELKQKLKESLKSAGLNGSRELWISTKNQMDREQVLKMLAGFVTSQKLEDEAVVTQARHFENLKNCEMLLRKSLVGLQENQELEFLAVDLKSALISIQETLGERFDDQIMDFVFKQFCIGK